MLAKLGMLLCSVAIRKLVAGCTADGNAEEEDNLTIGSKRLMVPGRSLAGNDLVRFMPVVDSGDGYLANVNLAELSLNYNISERGIGIKPYQRCRHHHWFKLVDHSETWQSQGLS